MHNNRIADFVLIIFIWAYVCTLVSEVEQH